MELIAKKTFRVHNGRRVKKGDRFTTNDVMGRIYLYAKNAEHPPRVLTPPPAPAPAPVLAPNPVRTPVYETRVMTADVDTPIVRRGRGRPRKSAEVAEPAEPLAEQTTEQPEQSTTEAEADGDS